MIGGECVSTIDAAASNATLAAMLPDGEGRFLPVGHPCDDFRGYCDNLQNCFIVDSEGALERLANIFFNADQLDAAIEWIRGHWWAVLVAGVGLLVGIFFIILIVHLLLPRPEHVKQRAERRRTIRRSRKQGNVHPDPTRMGHEMRVKH